ncbi:MAG TPA: hypothetical protein DCR63_04720 [Microbacterium sp.]|nr:hypothetical protein [Microbacterium sp.]
MAYAIIALSSALAIAAAQMGLSIAMTQGVYEERELREQVTALQYEQQSLTQQLVGLSSPQYLAANASALGMVINEAPSYLRLSDGAILGSGAAAPGQSTVDAIGRASVPNALVATAPLVTAPDATIQGLPEVPAAPSAPVENGPPALSEGLPAPQTR